jgi:hypothetical protein
MELVNEEKCCGSEPVMIMYFAALAIVNGRSKYSISFRFLSDFFQIYNVESPPCNKLSKGLRKTEEQRTYHLF